MKRVPRASVAVPCASLLKSAGPYVVRSACRSAGSDPRRVACLVLRRVRRDRAYASLTLSHALSSEGLVGAQRALATELLYGVPRHRRRIDAVIGLHSR